MRASILNVSLSLHIYASPSRMLVVSFVETRVATHRGLELELPSLSVLVDTFHSLTVCGRATLAPLAARAVMEALLQSHRDRKSLFATECFCQTKLLPSEAVSSLIQEDT